MPKVPEKNMQNCPKICFFSPIKHWFCFKKRSKSMFQPTKTCAVSGCVWKHPEWILIVLCTFMKVYMIFEPFFPVIIDPFERFWTIFCQFVWLFLTIFGCSSAETEKITIFFGGQKSKKYQRKQKRRKLFIFVFGVKIDFGWEKKSIFSRFFETLENISF